MGTSSVQTIHQLKIPGFIQMTSRLGGPPKLASGKCMYINLVGDGLKSFKVTVSHFELKLRAVEDILSTYAYGR